MPLAHLSQFLPFIFVPIWFFSCILQLAVIEWWIKLGFCLWSGVYWALVNDHNYLWAMKITDQIHISALRVKKTTTEKHKGGGGDN